MKARVFRRILVVSSLALLASALGYSSATAQTNRPMSFVPAEQLVYRGEFSKLLLRGIDVAEVRLTAARTPAPDRDQAAARSDMKLQFTGEVTSKGWFQRLFGLNFRYLVKSIVEPMSFGVVRNTTLDEQGKRRRVSETVFDFTERKIVWTERDPEDPNREPRVVTSPFDGATQDIISAIYFLRTQPLKAGMSFEVPVADNGAIYHIPARVVETKQFKTVLGKIEALRVDVDIFGEQRLVNGSGECSIWFTNDARHIPVRARLSNSLGTLDLKLKEWRLGEQTVNGMRSVEERQRW